MAIAAPLNNAVFVFPFLFVLSSCVPCFLYDIRACCRASAAVLQYRKHSTAQRNPAAQSRQASTCRSERDNASKQTELARASMSSSILYSISIAEQPSFPLLWACFYTGTRFPFGMWLT